MFASRCCSCPRRSVRAQRLSEARPHRRGERPADAAWDELVASASDLDAGGDAAETPRALAAHLAERPAFAVEERRNALIALRDAVERERYGPVVHGPADPRLLGELALTRAALADDARPVERARAVLLPRSLFDRARSILGERRRADA